MFSRKRNTEKNYDIMNGAIENDKIIKEWILGKTNVRQL
jgi:hypothetical protein